MQEPQIHDVYTSVTSGWSSISNIVKLPNGLINQRRTGEAKNSNSMEALQELQEASDPCFGRKCMANEHCCPSFVCIIRDQDVGSCFPLDGLGQGELCRHHSDCDTGLICYSNGDGTKTCQPPFASPKLYSLSEPCTTGMILHGGYTFNKDEQCKDEECTISNECDIHRGLCCQYQRRHRQAARKVCSYFKDPLVCIGPVASDQVKGDIERTAGEKRITSKSLDAFNHLRR